MEDSEETRKQQDRTARYDGADHRSAAQCLTKAPGVNARHLPHRRATTKKHCVKKTPPPVGDIPNQSAENVLYEGMSCRRDLENVQQKK